MPQILPPALVKLIRWAIGPGRAAVLLLLLVGGFFGGWWYVWKLVGPSVLQGKDYQVTVESIEIPPLPPWIRSTDIRREAFFAASLDRAPLSILDDQLVEQIRRAFAFHPWVAKVVSVRKFHPAGVKVDLIYREPVCVVQVDDRRFPVDVEAMPLPSESFTPVELNSYPQLIGIESGPINSNARWSDPRVAGGAEIAAALKNVWATYRLRQIVPVGNPDSGPSRESRYQLITERGTPITWGHAPGSETPGEQKAAQKVAKLEAYFKENNTLDMPGDRSQALDLTQAD